jgi:hypothetical protein
LDNHSWVSAMAEKEQERRKNYSIVKDAVLSFREILNAVLYRDLAEYTKHFPNEAKNIKEKGSGFVRESEEATKYGGTPVEVEFGFLAGEMMLGCQFTHARHLDKLFPLVVANDGSVAVEGLSVDQLSEYILSPILFNKLI